MLQQVLSRAGASTHVGRAPAAREIHMAKRVAVIGASHDRRKYGNKALRAFVEQGYDAVPVNPDVTEVEGLKAYPTIIDVPGAVDMVTFYVPPRVGLRVIEQVAQKGVREVWLNPGSESAALVTRARELGITPILACSIIAIGDRPGRY
jgi:predicted CoA-binding protein